MSNKLYRSLEGATFIGPVFIPTPTGITGHVTNVEYVQNAIATAISSGGIGATGATGATGIDGFIGSNGATGATGNDGATGATGAFDAVNQNALNNLYSSGVLAGCDLSINATDNTKFDMSSGLIVIIDPDSDAYNPVKYYLNVPAQIGIQDPYIVTADTTYIDIDKTGSFVFTPEEDFDTACQGVARIGYLDHPGNINIEHAVSQPSTARWPNAFFEDWMRAFGPFNVSGNTYGPGTGLQITRSSGEVWSHGSNWTNDEDDPHTVITGNTNPETIKYFWRDPSDASGWFNTAPTGLVVDPNHWDDGSGTLQVVPDDYFTVQLVSYFADWNVTDFQYGQAVYTAIYDATQSITNYPVPLNPYNDGYDVFRGWAVMKKGITVLTNPSESIFISAGNFGSGGAGTPGAQGFPGATGIAGNTGATGNIGATGLQGNTGNTGLQGNTGNTGIQGITGATGVNLGITGVTGPTGNTGATGPTSNVVGNTGATGATGVVGKTGNTGATGNSGTTGSTGATGNQGNSGSTGNQGNSGATGSIGLTGNSGSTGNQGYIGGTGMTGTTGVIGSTGNSGATGNQGSTGGVGGTGVTGTTGNQGYLGATGATGLTGIQGVTGSTGLTGNQGNLGATGPTGLTGVLAPGNTGMTGATGPTLDIIYQFDTTLSGNPASGFVRLDNATPSLATFVYISEFDIYAVGVDTWIDLLTDKIKIQSLVTPSKFHLFQVAGTFTSTGSPSYDPIPVTWMAGSGTFSNNEPIGVFGTVAGVTGATGPTGPTGIPGGGYLDGGQASSVFGLLSINGGGAV